MPRTLAGMVKNEAIAMELREIILKPDPPIPADNPSAAAVEAIQFGLSTESGLSTMANISDIHCIYYHQFACKAGVATYLPITQNVAGYPASWQWVDPLLIPHPKIYAYVLSSNASQVQTFHFRIGYTYVRLTGPEVMECQMPISTRGMAIPDGLVDEIMTFFGGFVAREACQRLAEHVVGWLKTRLGLPDEVLEIVLQIQHHSEAIKLMTLKIQEN